MDKFYPCLYYNYDYKCENLFICIVILFEQYYFLDPSGTEGPLMAPRNPPERIYASRYTDR